LTVLLVPTYTRVVDMTEAMITQKTKSAMRLSQSIDWKRVGMTRMVQGNGMPQ
jgi:hypothetical protein